MRQEAPTDGRAAGFIVLEALVALILLVFTLGLVASMLSFGQRLAASGRARDEVAHIANGSNALAGWLASATPFRPEKQTGPGPVLFEGRADRLSFVTTSIGDAQPPSLLAITVGFASARKPDALGTIVFDAVPLGLGEAGLPDTVASTVLFGQVLSAQFSYFGSPQEGVAANWRPDWTGAARLPRLVSLQARVAVGKRIESFRLNFRVMAE